MVTPTSSKVLRIQSFGGNTLSSTKMGVVNFAHNQRFQNVARIPDGKVNLLSVGTICDAGYKVIFTSEACTIQNIASGKVKYQVPRQANKLYVLTPSALSTASPLKASCFNTTTSSSTSNDAILFHNRLGHMHFQRLQSLHKHTDISDKIPSFKVDPSPCTTCLSCKATRPPVGTKILPPSPHVLAVCYADIKEFPISPTGMRYFISFIDSASRFTTIHLLRFKSDAASAIQKHFQYCRSLHNAVPREFHTDNAPDLCAGLLPAFFSDNNCVLTTCPPNTPEWNGVAERKNRTLDECARSLLHAAHLPLNLYSLAVKYACHLQNLWPNRTIQHRIPAAMWSNKQVSFKNLRVFGCDTYCLKRPEHQTLTRAQLGIFVGIKERNGCTMVYMPHSGRIWDVRSPTSVETSFTRPLDSPRFSQCGDTYETDADPTTSASTTFPPIPTNSLNADTSFPSPSSTPPAPYLAPLPMAVPLPPPALSHQRQSAVNARGRIQAIATYENPSSPAAVSVPSSSAVVSAPSSSAVVSAPSSSAAVSAPSSSAVVSAPSSSPNTSLPLRRSARIPVPNPKYNAANLGLSSRLQGLQFSRGSDGINPAHKVNLPNVVSPFSYSTNPYTCLAEDTSEDPVPNPKYNAANLGLSSRLQGLQFSRGSDGINPAYKVILPNVVSPSSCSSNLYTCPAENTSEDPGQTSPTRSTPLPSSSHGQQFSQSSHGINSVPQVYFSSLNPSAPQFTPSSPTHTRGEPEEPLNAPPDFRDAIKAEWATLRKLQVFTTVPRPPKPIRPIRSKWVLKVKANGQRKARLTAKGFMQKFGVNYDQTFAPVVNTTTVRYVLATAAAFNMNLHQLDVKSAFLNAPLKETIYMEHPEFYNQDPSSDTVLLVHKTLYGLKQAPLEWYKHLTSKLIQLGYTKSLLDPCLFFKRNQHELTLVPFHVDDLKIASNSPSETQRLRDGLADCFELSDVCDNYFLGVEVKESPDDIQLSQKEFIQDLLAEHNMSNCRTVATPITDCNLPPAVEDPDPELQHRYRSIVGSLLYVSNYTRPDVCFATNYLARFMHGPTEQHLLAALHLLRYLAGTTDYCISYKRNILPGMYAYSDASWSDPLDGRSTSGYLIIVGNAPIAWSSCRQPVPALSSCEAEYIGLSNAAQTILWLRALIQELGFPLELPTPIFGDNQAANLLAQHPSSAARTKHINVRFHFLQHHVQEKDISILYLQTSCMTADILTKGLQRIKHRQHTMSLLRTA